MKKKIKVLIAFMSLSICLSLMSNTYSRYIAGTTGNIDATFASWQILVNNVDITDENNIDTEIMFTPTIEENENIRDNKIAPSSKGYFDINIDPSNVDVSYTYSVDLNIEHELIPDLKATSYSIIVDDVESEKLELENNLITETFMYDKTTENFSFNKYTVRVYFEWLEGQDEIMDDNADSIIGHLAAIENLEFTFKANISFEQFV